MKPIIASIISITCVCSKIMEHIIYSHTANFLSPVNFYNPNQHGFSKGFSCDTQLALFLHDLHAYNALFLDFEKAFDSRLTLHSSVSNWIQSLLTHRQQLVNANSHSSCLSRVLFSAPQGTVLGPLLFLIYINDLPDIVSSSISSQAIVLFNTQ